MKGGILKGGILLTAVAFLAPTRALAADITVPVRAISAAGVGEVIGTLRAYDTRQGLAVKARVSTLAPGLHGFHVHENPACGALAPGGQTGAGLAAGGLFDPDKSGRHEGPHGQGHKGDLAALQADEKGRAGPAVLMPRLKVADLVGRSIVIHGGGDNYADQPAALGGGGARVACAVIATPKRSR